MCSGKAEVSVINFGVMNPKVEQGNRVVRDILPAVKLKTRMSSLSAEADFYF